MRIEQDIFARLARAIAETDGVVVGPCSQETLLWCQRRSLPDEIQNLFACCIPKNEIWAGAGALFDEPNIVRWNENLPEALEARLLIVGGAPNGDHIAIDLEDGSTGYISHEQDWQPMPRRFFIAVSPSIGSFLRDINDNSPTIPEDYWSAKNARS